MQRPWLKSYPAGVPAEVDVSRYASIVALYEESFAKYRDAPAYICMGRVWPLARSTGCRRGSKARVWRVATASRS